MRDELGVNLAGLRYLKAEVESLGVHSFDDVKQLAITGGAAAAPAKAPIATRLRGSVLCPMCVVLVLPQGRRNGGKSFVEKRL